ncbi:MAG: pyrroline-5-carboxylate reductase [Acidimicrobiia bacterium]|nr:pyrroline-5-carboxylate reductase [bacterium]MYD03750.1 pyrroline-5-carboxylate reductase [Acidimicrobiia bacterium]
MDRSSIAIVGVGAMGGALFSGLLEAGWEQADLTLIESHPPRAEELAETSGCRTVLTPAEGIEGQEIVVLAVKPQDIHPALAQLSEVMTADQVLVALVAGVPISVYERALGEVPIIRAMPNTPALVGEGVTVCAPGSTAESGHMALARAVLEAVGLVEEVEESLMDAVTAVSGSGPAYAYALAEAMIAEGVKQGLEPEVALRLVARTIKGAGTMMETSPDSPTVLRERVASPGGTTAAALEVMGRDGFWELVRQAVEAATERSKELGKIAAQP